MDFAGHAARQIGQKIECRTADIFDRDGAAQRRVLLRHQADALDDAGELVPRDVQLVLVGVGQQLAVVRELPVDEPRGQRRRCPGKIDGERRFADAAFQTVDRNRRHCFSPSLRNGLSWRMPTMRATGGEDQMSQSCLGLPG